MVGLRQEKDPECKIHWPRLISLCCKVKALRKALQCCCCWWCGAAERGHSALPTSSMSLPISLTPKTKRVHCLRIAHVCFDCMFGNAHAHMSQYVQRKMHDKKMTTGSYTWEYFYGSEFKSRRSRCSIWIWALKPDKSRTSLDSVVWSSSWFQYDLWDVLGVCKTL